MDNEVMLAPGQIKHSHSILEGDSSTGFQKDSEASVMEDRGTLSQDRAMSDNGRVPANIRTFQMATFLPRQEIWSVPDRYLERPTKKPLVLIPGTLLPCLLKT